MNPKRQAGVAMKVIILTIVFAWEYRADNTSATYNPDWSHSTTIEVVGWPIPCLIVIALGIITWKSLHDLDPL